MKNMQTIEGRFVYYTECQLATLEGLQMRKRTPKCDLQRQQKICDGMMEVVCTTCTDVDIFQCPRVKKLLETIRKT